MIFILAALLCSLIGFSILITKKHRSATGIFLVLFLLNISFALALKYLEYSNQVFHFPHLINIHYVVGLIRPPLFYLFVVYFIHNKSFEKLSLVHFIPAVGLLVYLFPYYSLPAEAKLLIEQDSTLYTGPRLPSWYIIAGNLYSVLHLMRAAKVVLPLWLTTKGKAKKSRNLIWINITFSGYLLYTIFACFNLFSNSPAEVSFWMYQAIALLVIGSLVFLLKPDQGLNESVATRYEKSTLTPDKRIMYLRQLNESMNLDQAYLKSPLRLEDLAESLHIPLNHVSQIINEEFGVSFSEWVNRYRVELAKKLLLEGSHDYLTIEAIGQEAGFSSRVGFFTTFKTMTGQTPRQYKELRRKALVNSSEWPS